MTQPHSDHSSLAVRDGAEWFCHGCGTDADGTQAGPCPACGAYGRSRRPASGHLGYALDRGLGCRTSRQAFGRGLWGVRVGKREIETDDGPSGTWLTTEEAEALAAHLLRCAAWVRAQECVESHKDAA